MMQIDTATPADIPALCGLLSALFAQEAEFTPDTTAQARGLAMIVSDPRVGSVLVARRDGEIVGMVNLLFTVSTALGERVVLLEDMVVAPSARGAGVGSALLTVAIDFARVQRCPRITLLTDRVNADAQRFYARHGFVASDMLPMRRVDG
ncbi:GNAT family N-acetyltransferase [Methyloversatilis discipulorum]|uniref:GNAT family N-acetyltransferase n=1 Tax=Methyloversatilis discipulorum TaxID=1119528 RepID=UPI00036957A6|nr:GNAT family N-acetyltransferase [Methyloversatilis discipulorum]